MTLRLLLCAALAVGSWLPSPAAAREAKPPSGRIFRMRLALEPATLDWQLGDISIPITQNIMRGLFRIDESGKVIPDLVDSFSSKEAGKRWLFQIKKGVKWSDGVAFTAHHAAAGMRRLLSPELASSYAYFLFNIEGARGYHAGKPSLLGIHALSDYELEVVLDKPLAFFPSILTHWVTYPVRMDLLLQSRSYWQNPERIATLGPYKIKEWIQNNRLVLVPNPHAERPPWFQRVEGWVVVEDQTAINLFDSGSLDFVPDPGPGAVARKDLVQKNGPILYFIGLGPGHPFSSKPEALRALSEALNRAEIPLALNAQHRPTRSLVPPELLAPLHASPEKIPTSADLGKAQTLLAKAGFTEPGKVPVLKLQFFNRPAISELAQWIQAQWQKHLGLRVELEGHEPKAYWSTLEKTPKAFFINSKGAAYPDADAFYRLFASAHGQLNLQNLGRWQDAEYDRWVNQAAETIDPDERRKLYDRSQQRLLVENPGAIPLFFRSTGYLVKSYVHGLTINPLTSIDFSKATYDGAPLNQ